MELSDLTDIILVIIELLPIPDIRNLLRCNKKLNLLFFNKNILSIIDINSLNWGKKLNHELEKSIIGHRLITLYGKNFIYPTNLFKKEKYTVEIVCFGYKHLIPNRYMVHNTVLSNSQICLHNGYNAFWDLIKFVKYDYYGMIHIAFGAIITGNLKILKWLKHNNFDFSNVYWHEAVTSCQLQVLKWAKNNGYNLNQWIFVYPNSDYKFLNIFKWAFKNYLISANVYHNLIL